ncbi:ABC-2 type transport system ATP-binding protein [Symbiobacterium terraclitae]|uniref:ABC-2 type transport system ATP-binding protein n=1 Tax=Symbiobacterium terraclitae TaxID=557451 RepID=A0ABS4JUI7_9FIRM|nr:ABC transporter ATP-binding protein [Symbiobacterium terraclitae]MBP2018124.1 ABC-2 type transport system ATP-binding protein [Symbiobacterium terraclitae]
MLRVEGLVKRYGDVEAVRDVTFAVAPGSIYGFVGPNGAGKTTTLKVIATLLRPDAGRVFIGDVDVLQHPEEARTRLGYMPDFFGVYDNLRVDEYMQFYADCYGVPTAGRDRLIGSLLELVDLADKREAYVDGLSRGMKQRLCLARCLVHDPDLLILDEPASGLDPRARVEMREILQELRRRGKTILISSHILAELAELCSHIGIIHAGRMVVSGPVEQIQREAGARVIEVRLAGGLGTGPHGEAGAGHAQGGADQPGAQGAVHPDTLATVMAVPGVRSVAVEDGALRVAMEGEDEAAAALLAHLVRAGLPVVHFAEVKSKLEDVFMAITGGEEQ